MNRLAKMMTVALGAAALAGSSQAANLIVNGDFSNPNTSGGFVITPSIPGWVNDNNDDLEVGASGIYGLACYTSGCQNLEVNANTFDTVSQLVTGLTVDDTYNLSWAYGGRVSGGPQELNVSFGGVPLTQDSSNGYAAWSLNSFIVKATATSETLTFASVDTSGEGGRPSYGNELTAVSLIAVPEPAAWALMLVGFGGLGAAMRSRRRMALAAV
jgi:hypothetical protein